MITPTILATQSLAQVVSTPLEIVFSLSSLDLIMQIGVAFLLAYLNLESFRYRKDAPRVAEDMLSDAKKESGMIDNIESYKSYKNLQSLHDLLKSISKDSCNITSIKKLTKSRFEQIFIVYFCKNIDRLLSLIFFILLIVFLIIDTQYFVYAYKFVNKYPDPLFYFIVFFSIFPIINIMLGRLMNNILITITKISKNKLTSTIKTLKEAEKNRIEKLSDHFHPI